MASWSAALSVDPQAVEDPLGDVLCSARWGSIQRSCQTGGVRVRVRVHVRAARARTEWRGDVLHVWVTAPPVEGAANQAVLEAVAGALGARRSGVRLLSGDRARDKLVEVERDGGE